MKQDQIELIKKYNLRKDKYYKIFNAQKFNYFWWSNDKGIPIPEISKYHTNSKGEIDTLAYGDANLDYLSEFNFSKLQYLTKLHTLCLFGFSNMNDINIEFIKNLKKLEVLYLEYGNLSNLHFVSNLTNIQYLNLQNNNIKNIDNIKFLKNIKTLDLTNNKITELPYEVFKNLDKIENWHEVLEGNPLYSPHIEIVKQGKQAIKDWFDSIRTENNEIKLILTGNTTAGKTTLVNFLTKEKYTDTTNSTHGIQINRWKIDYLNINIWDFGGQEYYHATHKLFLTSNSVYLLLWEKSKNKTDLFPTEIMISGKKEPEIKDLQHYDYIHWLNLIRRYTNTKNLSGSIRPAAFHPC